MKIEIFETKREFNKKFPSKLYICPMCKCTTPNPNQCTNCGNQSTNFIFSDKTYSYEIREIGLTAKIFKPIELEKGRNK